MKTFGHFLVVTVEISFGVTIGAFVAGYMYEAGRDAYKTDKVATIKEEAKKKATSLKDRVKGTILSYTR